LPDKSLRTVAELYDQHRRAAFPSRLTAADANGVEMAGLDATVSGCVSAWLRSQRRIDDSRWDLLADCEQKLKRAIPALDGDERSHCQRLLDMTLLILEHRPLIVALRFN
jgi:hypothetical protein